MDITLKALDERSLICDELNDHIQNKLFFILVIYPSYRVLLCLPIFILATCVVVMLPILYDLQVP